MAFDPATPTELEEEARWVEAAQAGDLNAMRPLLIRYADPLYAAVIMPRLGNAHLAEEVLRDTLATAVEKISRFTWQGKGIFPWLRQIAINKIVDVHRANQRQRRLASAVAAETQEASDPSTGADAQLIAAEEQARNRERIAQSLGALSDRYRQAIELRLMQELDREACARAMGVTVGTFDVLLFRAVRAFRKQFGDRDLTPAPAPRAMQEAQ